MGKVVEWLLEAAREQFGGLVAPLWSSLGFWRGAAIFLTLAVVGGGWLVMKQRHRLVSFLRRDAQQDHDRNIFRASDGIMGERALKEMLGTLGGDHCNQSSA